VPPIADPPSYRDRVRGSLLGGAVGDALGAGVEFSTISEIRQQHGPAGVTGFTPAYGHAAPITDDTQLTLFTAEGLIRASVRADRGVCHPPTVMWFAYQRWLSTQGEQPPVSMPSSGWLVRQPVLHARRAPGNAVLAGLRSGRMGTVDDPENPQSKGCGAVMRSAPFGWLRWSEDRTWSLAIECAVLTHGHPSGFLSAAAFALIIRRLLDGVPLAEAVAAARDRLRAEDERGRETERALAGAMEAAGRGAPTPERVAELGGGWVGEEALAIAVYCALAAPTVERALLAAVNHSGDSDSTGAICGNLLGAEYGDLALPLHWVADVEGRGLLLEVAEDFAYETLAGRRLHGDRGPHTGWPLRYPGS
jgi:ADP-ribosylglycohydrolase